MGTKTEKMHTTLDSIFLKFTKNDKGEIGETDLYYNRKIKEYLYTLLVYNIEGYEFWDLINKYNLRIYCIEYGHFGVIVQLSNK